jgi:hypothetical protein
MSAIDARTGQMTKFALKVLTNAGSIDAMSIENIRFRQNPKNSSGIPAFFCRSKASLLGIVGGSTARTKDSAQAFEERLLFRVITIEDHIAGNNKFDFGAGIG